MINTEVNPSWLDENAYIEFLNQGFAGHWDRASFEFYARRTFHGRPADIGVRADGQRIAAGVSYCYRQLRVGSAAPIDVCVMSAGTTIPGERGRGHYVELLRLGLDLSREKKCAAILGFVTRDNASGRGLARLGAYSIPSYYLMSEPGGSSGPRLRGEFSELPPVQAIRWSPHLQFFSGVQFHYPSGEEWLQQFTARPNRVRALRLSHDSLALIETVDQTDRLQWLGCPDAKKTACIARLAAQSRHEGRQFFMYTLDPLLARCAARWGMRRRDGLLMLLPVDATIANWEHIAGSAWRLQSGDRI